MSFLVNEIFYSIQGEGLRAGEATIFVRFSGCNLSCDFCDTKYHTEYVEMEVEQIMEEILKIAPDCPWVCITGGEPCFQNVQYLTHKLRIMGWKVQIETNGTIVRENLFVDHLTISPKAGHPMREILLHPGRYATVIEVKYVVSCQGDMPFEPFTPASLQPMSNTPEAIEFCIKKVKEEPTKWRLSLQLHKTIGIR